jgi:hypothetical protein
MNEKPTRSQVRFQTMHEGKAISCVVSDRYIALKADADAVVAFGTPVWLDVMTSKYGSAADRKICQLCVSLEELEKVVIRLRREVEITADPKKGADH